MITNHSNNIKILMSTTTSNYCCGYCSKSFILKHNYDKHISTCSFFYKSGKEISNEIDNAGPIPSLKDMYSLVQDMAMRIQKLEKDNANLRQRTNKENNPLTILKHMKPDVVFSQWVKKYILSDVKNYLQTVFEYTLFDGIIALFQDTLGGLRDQSCLPVQYYPNKQNNLYVYEVSDKGNDTWKIATNVDLDKYIRMVTNEFYIQFGIWHENNQELLENDSELFPAYYQKILSDDKLCKRKIKKQICDCLSNNLE